jgi:hypothetical protein
MRHKAFDPEEIEIMAAAFEQVCRVLWLPKRDGHARSTAAVLIIELMARGERNPSKLAYSAAMKGGKSLEDFAVAGTATTSKGNGRKKARKARK